MDFELWKSTLHSYGSPAMIVPEWRIQSEDRNYQHNHSGLFLDISIRSGQGDASGGNQHAGSGQSFSRAHLLAVLERALCCAASSPQLCAPTVGAWASLGGNPQRAHGQDGGLRPHRDVERPALGRAAPGCLRWTARRPRGNRKASRRHPLAALPRPLSAAARLPGGRAIRKSFRPTASRACGSQTQTPNPNQNPLHSASQSSMEKALEADNSKLQKTGHFYFALTGYGQAGQKQVYKTSSPVSSNRNFSKARRCSVPLHYSSVDARFRYSTRTSGPE